MLIIMNILIKLLEPSGPNLKGFCKLKRINSIKDHPLSLNTETIDHYRVHQVYCTQHGRVSKTREE